MTTERRWIVEWEGNGSRLLRSQGLWLVGTTAEGHTVRYFHPAVPASGLAGRATTTPWFWWLRLRSLDEGWQTLDERHR